MPELPEVETTLRGIAPHVTGKKVVKTEIRQYGLRWPVHPQLAKILSGQILLSCTRRAKYLVLQFETGVLLVHLGMSGSLRIYPPGDEHIVHPQKHDHLDMHFSDGTVLRYRDPRRFGAVLWYEGAAEHHPLLEKAGPEPLSDAFDAAYLYAKMQASKRAVKLVLMDNAVVVGVGNIYANESLFRASVAPQRPADSLSRQECRALADAVRSILEQAIATGGSTLRDFVGSDGKSGYFQQQYTVYGRHNQPCLRCGGLIQKQTIGQRGTFYCPACQK